MSKKAHHKDRPCSSCAQMSSGYRYCDKCRVEVKREYARKYQAIRRKTHPDQVNEAMRRWRAGLKESTCPSRTKPRKEPAPTGPAVHFSGLTWLPPEKMAKRINRILRGEEVFLPPNKEKGV